MIMSQKDNAGQLITVPTPDHTCKSACSLVPFRYQQYSIIKLSLLKLFCYQQFISSSHFNNSLLINSNI